VRLPVVGVGSPGEPVPEEVGPAPGPGRRRVLVADDNRDSADSMAVVLRMMGHDVRTVHDGRQAIDEAAVFRPDVALLDIGMPQVDGYEAARRIREAPWGQAMLLVALTGWGQDEDRRRAAEAGFDLHFTKPIDVDEIEKLLVDRQRPVSETMDSGDRA
jgi:CheY-like chemotaxis protein